MSVTNRLAELGITLPEVTTPVANYTPALRTGNYVYTSGQLPMVDGKLTATGQVSVALDVEEAAQAARVAVLNAVAAAAAVVGGPDALRPVKVVGFVSSPDDFYDQPAVINGASDVLGEIFQTPHARSAVGAPVLPLNSAVEVEVVFEVKSES